MNNPRSTRIIKTDGGREVVIYDYITGREAQEIASLASQKIEGKSEYDMQIAANNEAFRKVVVSFDGKKAGDQIEGRAFDPVQAILDLPMAEFAQISAVISELIDPKKK